MQIFLPYPHYDNDSLIDNLAADPKLTIGRWVKKSVGAIEVAVAALISQYLLFILRPAWDDYYRSNIAPSIKRFLKTNMGRLKDEGVSLEYLQFVEYESQQIEVRFILVNGYEERCLAPDLIIQGATRALERLESDPRASQLGVTRVILVCSPDVREYSVKRVEYRDGTVGSGVVSAND